MLIVCAKTFNGEIFARRKVESLRMWKKIFEGGFEMKITKNLENKRICR
jgi:hypothetical protein